jgi:hypothetical protein
MKEKPPRFIAREQELNDLEGLMKRKKACLAVIKGRRRIGKSRLAEEFGKNKRYLPFSGLTPVKGITAQKQRDEFARKLETHFRLKRLSLSFNDWTVGFELLSARLSNVPTVVVFDEISWMAAKDPTFVPKLKVWWDLNLQKFPKLVLILCGSVSTWIDKNIINSTALFGRISLSIELNELTLPECQEFLTSLGFKSSYLDVYRILSVTGGVPWYLEQIRPDETADENLKRLCFKKEGVLVKEFPLMFHDLFSARGTVYKAIVKALLKGMLSLGDICKQTKHSKNGSMTKYLANLKTCGFVTAHKPWSLKTGKLSKTSLYRLSDNYLHFYLRYIEPRLSAIEEDRFKDQPISSLPGWETIMGLQIENLLLKNRSLILKALGLHPQDILTDNPFVQTATIRRRGCQIDYLIQTHTRTLFACEIKVRHQVGTEVINEMEEKLRRISLPKGYAFCSALFYLGALSNDLALSPYFFRTVDIATFLK